MTIKDRLINLFNHQDCLTINDGPLLTNVEIEHDGILKIQGKWVDDEGLEYSFKFDDDSLESAKDKNGTFEIKDVLSGEFVDVAFFKLEKLK